MKSYLYNIADKLIEKNKEIHHNSKYKHAAVVFLHNNPYSILSYGYNNIRYYCPKHNQGTSIHAEVQAMLSLKINTSNKKININMLVIRYSAEELNISKPCQNCVDSIKKYAEMKNYCINVIYYSDEQGYIQKISYNKLSQTTTHISKFHRKLIREKILECE